ncbi:MAG TPA: hypothetical protein VIV60_12360 [Polyangiaceae bacterium]
MPHSKLSSLTACLVTLISFTQCTDKSAPAECGADDPSCAATAGGTNGTSASSQTGPVGGTSSTAASSGGATGAGGTSSVGSSAKGGSTGSSGPIGGTTASSAGGSTGSTSKGGSTAAGGSTGSTSKGGSTATGGSSTTATGGTSAAVGGSTAKGGSVATGGTSTTGGTSALGGTSSTGGSATGGVRADSSGVGLAAPGDSKNTPSAYLNLGDFRLLNNRWGSDELNCSGTQMKVYVNADKSLGWDFNRPTCGGEAAKPDYPEIEFGVHPFGAGNALETSPPFSSTTLLPKQIKDITSASITIDNLNITLSKASSWNLNFEFWLSQRNPATDPNPGVTAELIAFWGWENGRWPCDKSGTVSSGNKTYKLCHQVDNWADGKWKYYQFWVEGGPLTNFSGKVDIKPFIDWLVNNYGYSKDQWITRFEVGSEIDDNTAGSVKLNNISFEINGTTKSVELK